MALAEGAVPGVVTAVVRSFTDWLHDQQCKRRLRKILQDPHYRFDTVAHLSTQSGASPERTRELLTAIGARPSETDLNIWTLRQSRVL